MTKFRILCSLKSMTIKATFNYFVNGFDSNGDAVSDSVYRERALMLGEVRDLWLERIGYYSILHNLQQSSFTFLPTTSFLIFLLFFCRVL